MAYYDQYRGQSAPGRRPSFSGQRGVPFPQYQDQFNRQTPFNDFSDPFAVEDGFDEVSRPPRTQPWSAARPNMRPPSVQPFPQQPYQAFPPPGQMQNRYSVGTREQQHSHHSRSHPPSSPMPTGRLSSRPAFEDSPLTDEYYPIEDHQRQRTLSTGTGYGAMPPLVTAPMAMTPYNSQFKGRTRRSSTSAAFGPPMMDGFRRFPGTQIKFRVKGSWRQGVTLHEATNNVRLSGSSAYTIHELNIDSRGRLHLRVRWTGYRSLTYEIPVSSSDGYAHLQSLARRIARAVVHFLQTNAIMIPWDRVVLHRLEELSPGMWMPVLTTI